MSSSQRHLFSDYAERQSKQDSRGQVPLPNRGRRVRIVVSASILWTALIVGRLYQLQISEYHSWNGTAHKQHASTITLASERGAIYDRNGKILATSVPGGSVFVRPRQVRDKVNTAGRLSQLLDIPREDVLKKLESKSPFVWVQRQVPRPIALAVEKEELPGVGFLLESRRYYPYGSAASTLLGKVGTDGKGLSGLEAFYEGHLASDAHAAPVARDGVGKILHVTHELTETPRGKPLSLTIDAPLQLIMDEELEAGREKAQAKRAFAVMMNSVTGEILGLSQSPSPNFNLAKLKSRELLENHVMQLSFEPGSIMKPFVAALAIEHEVTHFHELINCENGAYRYGGHTINDVHPSAMLSTYNVVVHSSNVGMTKLGHRLGKERIYEGLRLFGFGENTGLPFPGEASGLLRDPKKWYPIDIATHSFGQGVAVTPLQVVRAISALANGGILPKVSLVYGEGSGDSKRVLSSKTAEMARRMLVGVVEEKGGTGSRARVPGVVIGGKTGTAQRPRDNGVGYEPGAYIASFVGFADGSSIGVDTPLTLLVVMDRPQAKVIDGGRAIYGGVASAPVFQRIMHRSLHFLSTQGSGYNSDSPRSSERELDSSDPLHSDGLNGRGQESLPERRGTGFRFVSYRG
ncbi:MAG: penicillin-binding protein 2 [Bdellovibrionales bacterium]|nr:penicillin-binding protein 2 [Bdellovibrionales bacterium]